jgi:acyl dehydratase
MTSRGDDHIMVFEDCAVGDQLPPLHRLIDLSLLVRYAGASGDFNPIHFDEAHARSAGLDAVVGQGMLALGLVSQAVTNWLGDSGQMASLNARFVGSYRVGDRLTVMGEVTGRSADANGRTQLDLRLSCGNQAGEEIIGNATARVVSR